MLSLKLWARVFKMASLLPDPHTTTNTDEGVEDNYSGNMDINTVIGPVPMEAVANGLISLVSQQQLYTNRSHQRGRVAAGQQER